MIEAVRYADDADAHVDYPITDATGANVDWASPSATATQGTTVVTVACTWVGNPAATRTLRVPVGALGVGWHTLRLIVPGDNDVELGRVRLR